MEVIDTVIPYARPHGSSSLNFMISDRYQPIGVAKTTIAGIEWNCAPSSK